MKKLLLSTALTFVAMSGAASAQSVLERVLGQIDNSTNLASVNGTFANIAENIGGASAQTIYVTTTGGALISEDQYQAGLAAEVASAIAATPIGAMPVSTAYADTTAGQAAYVTDLGIYNTAVAARATAVSGATTTYEGLYTSQTVVVPGLFGVDGSINTTVTGLNSDTQQAIAGLAIATEWGTPTIDIGNLATTALGAVNTGEITLGVNGSVDDAKTSSTQAVSTVMSQIGGSADTGALVLNVASNMTGVNGSINTTMSAVNGSVGNASTTALGAVNTGTITSGVNAAVQGIVGVSGQ